MLKLCNSTNDGNETIRNHFGLCNTRNMEICMHPKSSQGKQTSVCGDKYAILKTTYITVFINIQRLACVLYLIFKAVIQCHPRKTLNFHWYFDNYPVHNWTNH